MNDINFVDRVKKHFKYLEYEYGFRITNQGNSETVRKQMEQLNIRMIM
jgi:hypothetical protein